MALSLLAGPAVRLVVFRSLTEPSPAEVTPEIAGPHSDPAAGWPGVTLARSRTQGPMGRNAARAKRHAPGSEVHGAPRPMRVWDGGADPAVWAPSPRAQFGLLSSTACYSLSFCMVTRYELTWAKVCLRRAPPHLREAAPLPRPPIAATRSRYGPPRPQVRLGPFVLAGGNV
ncbi:hypothetical protein SKAU_G00332470 [Synaphobranchus kaupii]|uniref:Uncharacterized protein n=1 Tax=Synaphobranchus kaupii TaxID=118154 RepID=A0A9Q1ELE9_SYNKA|nr:hypothetical protein SKAU_G00332470 [Synaphobranchus kaupii]